MTTFINQSHINGQKVFSSMTSKNPPLFYVNVDGHTSHATEQTTYCNIQHFIETYLIIKLF